MTGVLAPYVLKRIDHDRVERQKARDDDLARQARLIEIQSQLLEDFGTKLWRWRYLSMHVSYVGMDGPSEDLAAAQRDYDTQVWEVLSEVRNEVSKLRRFVSEKAYRIGLDMYRNRMVVLDQRLKGAKDASSDVNQMAAYRALNLDIYGEISEAIDQTLHQIAVEAGLAPKLQ